MEPPFIERKQIAIANSLRLTLILDKKVDPIPEGWTSMQNRRTKVNALSGNTRKVAVARA